MSEKTYKGTRYPLYFDEEWNELFPALKKLSEIDEHSINFLIKKAVRQYLYERKMIKRGTQGKKAKARTPIE
jgi:hypothetical protein